LREIDETALKAAKDERVFSDFLESQKRFISNCIFSRTGKFVTKSDDEWSVATIAFYDAVKTYEEGKGGFLPYAKLVIHSRLADHYRHESRHNLEVPVDPSVYDTEPEEDDENAAIKAEIAKKVAVTKDDSVKYEIEAANEEFKKFGFTFYDLSECSPKSSRTREACRQCVLYILDNKEVRDEIYDKKQLPIKNIQQNTNLPRKLIERHRIYIIAATELLSGEYPCLAGYVSYIRRRSGK
jgi:RNA polymerase sigma factor